MEGCAAVLFLLKGTAVRKLKFTHCRDRMIAMDVAKIQICSDIKREKFGTLETGEFII